MKKGSVKIVDYTGLYYVTQQHRRDVRRRSRNRSRKRMADKRLEVGGEVCRHADSDDPSLRDKAKGTES